MMYYKMKQCETCLHDSLYQLYDHVHLSQFGMFLSLNKPRLLFQLSVVNPENFKEINAWEVLKFLKTKQ